MRERGQWKSVQITVSIKSLKEAKNRGFNPSLRYFLFTFIKSSLAHRVRRRAYFESLWSNFWGFLFHLTNFERILGSKKGYVHGTCCPKSRIGLHKASLGPPILVGQARHPVFNRPMTNPCG
jgi:hypothetical protein